MPEQRLQKTRDDYQGFIAQGVLAKKYTYLGDNFVMGIINGEHRIRLVDGNDCRWLLPEER